MNIRTTFELLLLTMLLAAVPVAAGNATKGSAGRPHEKATFAGGCFWCMEEAFEAIPGVVSVTSGYTGGKIANPTYEEVSAGGTGHAEVVEVLYDPEKVSYAKLLDAFWHNIDPTTPDRQFCDEGNQYRSVIFYHDEIQKRLAEDSKHAIERTKPFREPIVTQIVPASAFYAAEDYHQNFYLNNPFRYKLYKYTCGRAQRLAELWGKEESEENRGK